MTLAKVWLRIFVTGYVAVFAMWLVSLTTLPPYGDLTRIGHLAEEDFGWTKPGPTVDPAYLKAAPVGEADVLVIGDSFSMTLYWQASLVKAGYRVATTYWGQYGTVMCKDFDQWLQRAGFKGKLIIFESVERLLDERTVDGQACNKVVKPFESKLEPFVKPATLPGPDALPNWTARFDTGPEAYYNSWRAKRSSVDLLFNKNTWVRSFPEGCKYFSHRECNKLPVFVDEEGNGPLTTGTLERIKTFAAQHPAIPQLWMVIPNKATVYLRPEFSKDFVKGFVEAKLGPDLYAFSREKSAQIQDFFFSNDTHLSMHGQLALGEHMLGVVREVLPVPQAKSP
ncbi:hypothetical protein H6CHR_01310 [Variovorax sp. PBL-H6]|uniref:HAD family hydrolase n=1 Tax=Variovorax sp. PBL-H6 TaxID=434009 RepID=UPI001317A19F|nr:HAD family hydrolase [Variovorax sp. PBL-H6]VTU20063.1 hypothetical protein H6CHR_01310 [Variovorax sp. PBL-H6]